MNTQKDTYSNYKHRNNWKALIGIAPNVVTFVGKLFPGSTSDKIITLKSRLLEQLVPGDLILADKKVSNKRHITTRCINEYPSIFRYSTIHS